MTKDDLLVIDKISKNFYGNPALIDVSLTIHPGEVVGLVGENGAGKSTLLKIIMGVQPPSSGLMFLNSESYKPTNPKEANKQGVGMVFQEQSLITNLTVGQNIFFGDEKQFNKFGFINYRKMYERSDEVLNSLNIDDIKSSKYIRDYKFASRQMVEISKVINQAYSSKKDHALILLDEPTSVLNESEIRKLFSEVKRLASNGHSIIFVSHRLDEVLEISDRIYVFKDAKKVGEFETSKTTEKMLYESMVGRESSHEYYFIDLQREPEPEIVFEAEDLSLFGTFKDISFQLKKGEILGIYGVIGSGKEEVCSVLSGDLENTSGKLLINGREVKFFSPSDALSNGVAMLPQERNIEGVVGVLSVADNIACSSFSKLGKWGFVNNKRLVQKAKDWIEKLRIRTPDHKTSVNNLSGGNAQKVLFAKILSTESEIIILNHPTRGVDVGAKEEIYHLIRNIVNEGKSIVMLADTLDECIGMCNRIIVMKDGLITGEFLASKDEKPDKLSILECMM